MLISLFRWNSNSEWCTIYYRIVLFSWIFREALSFCDEPGNTICYKEMIWHGARPRVFLETEKFWIRAQHLWLSKEKSLYESQSQVLFCSVKFSAIVLFLDSSSKLWCSLSRFLGLGLVFKVDEPVFYCYCLRRVPPWLTHQRIVLFWHF